MLVQISNTLSTGATASYRRAFGVAVMDWRVLAHLAVGSDCPAQRICEVIGFDTAMVSRVVKALQASGEARVAADSSNSRRRKI